MLFELRNQATQIVLALGPLLIPGAALAVAALAAYLATRGHLSAKSKSLTRLWSAILIILAVMGFAVLGTASLTGPPLVDTSLGRMFFWNPGEFFEGLIGRGADSSSNRDVWANVAAYLVLAAITYLIRTRYSSILLPVAFSLLIELIQYAFPGSGRSSNVADILSNLSGALLGVLTVIVTLRIWRHSRAQAEINAVSANR